MTDFSTLIGNVADRSAYGQLGDVLVRWGQLLRQDAEIRKLMVEAEDRGLVVPLQKLARVRSGVVTRANPFFIVRELAFDQIPIRFHVTRRDLGRVAVVMDGKQTPFKIERFNLKPIIKGPEALLTPSRIAEDDQRLLDVRMSKNELRAAHANGTLAYLRRGETVEYKVSEDSLKGGIPAARSNIVNRRPYWYSVGVPDDAGGRLAVPEHHDRRYIATLVPDDSHAVIIDTCYSVDVFDREHIPIVHLCLNSLMTWYQLELRGRTQHGEGVLKVKIPDWHGILVLNPDATDAKRSEVLAGLWAEISDIDPGAAVDALPEPARVRFNREILEAWGSSVPDQARLHVERELRAAIAERHSRKESVAEAKRDRTPVRRATASVDAFASRIAATLEPFPDPRQFVPDDCATVNVPISESSTGTIRVGDNLFSYNSVFSGDVLIASGPDQASALFIRGVLLHDPELTQVEIPMQPSMSNVVERWTAAGREWKEEFGRVAREHLTTIADERLSNQIRDRALVLLHAQ